MGVLDKEKEEGFDARVLKGDAGTCLAGDSVEMEEVCGEEHLEKRDKRVVIFFVVSRI